MRIDIALIAIVLAVVLFLSLLVSSSYGRRSETTAFPYLYWIGLTVVTLTAGGLASFVGVNVLYFVGGAGAGAVGLVASVAFFVITPIAWAAVLRRRQRSVSTHRSAQH